MGTIICRHDRLRRQCDECDMSEEIAQLRADLARIASACGNCDPSTAHYAVARLYAEHQQARADLAEAREKLARLRPTNEIRSAREAARRRMRLDGADAQALEHALTITERERDAARADLARVTVELDEAIEDRRQARDDAARAAALLAVRTMERDARPAISREMARAWTADGIPYDEQVRAGGAIDAALRAHAAGSGVDEASGGVCGTCRGVDVGMAHWTCLACNGTGRNGGTDV